MKCRKEEDYQLFSIESCALFVPGKDMLYLCHIRLFPHVFKTTFAGATMKNMSVLIIISLLTISLLPGCAREESYTGVPGVTTEEPIIYTGVTGVTTEESMIHDGLTRTYRLYVPTSYDNTPTPLVFVLHFGGGSAAIIETVTEMTEKAEKEGFIVVYPDGTGKHKDRLLTWNAGYCAGYALEHNIDDVGFIQALVEHFCNTLTIDSSRIYVTGLCNGAALTYRIGAELSGIIAAIAPVAGSIGGIAPDGSFWQIREPEHPVSVIVFHGMEDSYVTYNGGLTKGGTSIVSVADSVSFWVEHNNCVTAPEREISESGNITVDRYAGESTDVVLYTLVTGGHAWPGGKKFTGGDEPTTELSATNIIWEFFETHPKQQGINSHIRTEFIDPVATDPLITPLHELPDSGERNLSHFIAVDITVDHPSVLYLHLPGSGGLPEDYQYVSLCAASCGYHVVNLAYCNYPAVRILIKGIKDTDLPECIRRERLYGGNYADTANVSRADSVENRLLKVLQYNHKTHPDEGWDTFYTGDHIQWDRIVVGGHSQGAGHAAFLAKEHNLAGVIIFAGPGDFVAGYGPAPWLSYENVTPPERMYAFTHASDPFSQAFFTAQRILGLQVFGPLQNVDTGELTSHMLTTALPADSQNYHSCIIVDEYVLYNEDGAILYEYVWVYMFTRLL